MNIIDYVATYLSNLPPDHPINEAFGQKLNFLMDDELNLDNNIFLYRFPITEYSETTVDIEGVSADIISSERFGICLIPLSGRGINLTDYSTYPAFLCRCRHKLPGRAWRTLEEIIYELHDNARVFPQNGVIYSTQTNPSLLYADKRLIYCFQAAFKVIVAERIK